MPENDSAVLDGVCGTIVAPMWRRSNNMLEDAEELIMLVLSQRIQGHAIVGNCGGGVVAPMLIRLDLHFDDGMLLCCEYHVRNPGVWRLTRCRAVVGEAPEIDVQRLGFDNMTTASAWWRGRLAVSLAAFLKLLEPDINAERAERKQENAKGKSSAVAESEELPATSRIDNTSPIEEFPVPEF